MNISSVAVNGTVTLTAVKLLRMVPTVDMLTTREAAERLGVTQSWVRRLIRDGRLPGTKHGRDYLIKANDLEAFAKLPREKTGRPTNK